MELESEARQPSRIGAHTHRAVLSEGSTITAGQLHSELNLYTDMVMEPVQGKLASSQFDFGYTEQFCIPGVTSVFFSSFDIVVGDSLEFNQANRGSLHV